MIDHDLLFADVKDENDSQRMKARLAWRRRMEEAGDRLADEVERREREESAPSTNRRAHLRGGSSLLRRDPMPVLFVVGLAVLSLFAIFGFISIGQFLQEIWGGK